MNKKQIEILFDMYEKIKSDSEDLEKALNLFDSSNHNFFDYWINIFNNFMEIIKIENPILYDKLEYLIYETNLWKNKLSGNKYINWKIELWKPWDYYILINDKKFILKNKEDCINFLIENNYINNENCY